MPRGKKRKYKEERRGGEKHSSIPQRRRGRARSWLIFIYSFLVAAPRPPGPRFGCGNALYRTAIEVWGCMEGGGGGAASAGATHAALLDDTHYCSSSSSSWTRPRNLSPMTRSKSSSMQNAQFINYLMVVIVAELPSVKAGTGPL